MPEIGYEECVMALQDMKCQGGFLVNLRMLPKASLATQSEAAKKAAAKEVAGVKIIVGVQRAGRGLAEEHLQQQIKRKMRPPGRRPWNC